MKRETPAVLDGKRILVAEDEYLIADDLRAALTAVGAIVIGPMGQVAEVVSYIDGDGPLDAAVLDVNLRGEMIFEAADALVARNVPIIFATGYDRALLPERFQAVPRLDKPVTGRDAAVALAPLLTTDRRPPHDGMVGAHLRVGLSPA